MVAGDNHQQKDHSDTAPESRIDKTGAEAETRSFSGPADQDYSGMLQGFFDVALDLLCIADTDGNFLKVNRAWGEILGYDPAELERRQFLEFVHPDDLETTLEAMAALGKQEQVVNFINRYRCKDGNYRYIEWRSHPHGKLIYAAARDVTRHKEVEQALRESEMRSRALVEAIPDMLFRYDRQGNYLDAQIKDQQMLHPQARSAYQEEGLVGKNMSDVLSPETAELLLNSIALTLDSGELQVVQYSYQPAEERMYFEARLVAIGEDEVVSIVRDVTESERREAELKYLSLHDTLTGLYNRAYFESELIRLEGGRDYPVAIISADLDGLKLVNDTLGHKEGDNYLQASASVLRDALRSSDIICRVGGDEFALILPQTEKKDGMEIMARIRRYVERYNSEVREIPLSVSMGLAVCKNSNQMLEDAYAEADRIMYKDKLQRSKEARAEMIRAMLASLYTRGYFLEGNNEQMQELCIKLAQVAGLDDQQMADLVLLTQVYEIGKIAVPEEILRKKGKLTEVEWEIVRQHVEKGYRISNASPDLAHIADLILRHHENFDGSGYPLGLKGKDIPAECRILALANAFTAMTNPRPYAPTYSRETALREVKRCSGKLFDPDLVSQLQEVLD